MHQGYDVYGVGNAIVDTEVQIDDTLLTAHGLERGIMTLVSAEDQETLRRSLGGREHGGSAGGSAANTMVGIAQFGGRAFYTGKVGNDMPGALYRESMAEAGVDFEVEATAGATGSCLVLVSPDGERTMRTHLGASSALSPGDIQQDHIARSGILYVEGYLWGGDSTRAAAERAIQLAKSAGVPVALSLSDPAMVQAFRGVFRGVIKESVDLVFCNEYEAAIYAGGSSNRKVSAALRAASLKALANDCPRVFMTCGSDGSFVHDQGAEVLIPGHPVKVVDTTGAGDVYAAGVLYGLAQSLPPIQAAKLGSYAAAMVVMAFGPRLKQSLTGQVKAILAGANP